MKHSLRWHLLRFLGVLAIVLILLRLALPWVVGGLIRDAIAQELPQAKIHLGTVRLNLWTGGIQLRNAKMESPFGDAVEGKISVKRIYVAGGLWALLGDGQAPIAISTIVIESPKLLVEGEAMFSSNLEELLATAPVTAFSSAGNDDPTSQSPSRVGGDDLRTPPGTPDTRPEFKFILRSLDFTGGQIVYRGKGMDVSMDLPELHLKDVGAEQDGMTAPEIIAAVLAHLVMHSMFNF